MKLIERLLIAYAPLVARFRLIDGPAAQCGRAEGPRSPRVKRGFGSGDLRAAIGRRTPRPRWRTA